MSTITKSVKGVGETGDVKIIDLQSPISSLIGQQVLKVGRSSGLKAELYWPMLWSTMLRKVYAS